VKKLKPQFRKLALLSLAIVLLAAPATAVKMTSGNFSSEKPFEVARSYFMATLARDYDEAYSHISTADRQLLSRADYAQAQERFSGFALRLARMVAAQTEFRVLEHEIGSHRARLFFDYKAPAVDELSTILFDWDQNKLNGLSSAQRRRLIRAVATLKAAPNPISTEGRDTLNLVNENGQWKIVLDWASGLPISFDAAVSEASQLTVDVLVRRLFAGADEPFQTSLRIKNRGRHGVAARIDHRIEPKEYAEHVAMIACGFLRPIVLQPGEDRVVSSAYLLDPDIPKGAALNITFVFHLANTASADEARSAVR
jgi:hypothetical protein